jgi:prevent-host-death family protein
VQITASELRANIYRILDQVLETGIPIEIKRKSGIVRIVPVKPRSKLSRLKKRDGFVQGDSDDFIEMDWSGEWKP